MGDRLFRGARRQISVGAAALDARPIVRPGPTGAEEKCSVSSQRAIGDHAGKHGVTIGLEALNRFECYLVNTMADCRRMSTRSIMRTSRRCTTRSTPTSRNPIRSGPTRSTARNRPIHISKNDRGVPAEAISRGKRLCGHPKQRLRQLARHESFGRGLKDLRRGDKGLARVRRKPRSCLSRRLRTHPGGLEEGGALTLPLPSPREERRKGLRRCGHSSSPRPYGERMPAGR